MIAKNFLDQTEPGFYRLERENLMKISEDIERPLLLRLLAEICLTLKEIKRKN